MAGEVVLLFLVVAALLIAFIAYTFSVIFPTARMYDEKMCEALQDVKFI